MRHGLMDISQNGLLIYGHGGDLFYHHSTLALLPEQNMGVFISINTDVSFPGFHNLVFKDFIDTYFPEKVETLPGSSAATLAPFTGSYAWNRYSYDDIFKIGKLAFGFMKVETTADGYLKTTLGDFVHKWAQQEDLIFRHTESSEVLVFERGANDRITHAFIGDNPTAALEKLEGVDSPLFHQAVFWISIVTFLVTLGYWLFSLISKRKSKKVSDFPIDTKRITTMILVIVLLFYFGIATLFSRGVELVYGIPNYAYLLFSLPFLIIGLISILCYQVIKIWINKSSVSLWKKSAITFICVCLVTIVYQWNYWNLIGFNF